MLDFFWTTSIQVGQGLGLGLELGLGLGLGIGFVAFYPKTVLVMLEPHAGHTIIRFFPCCIMCVDLDALHKWLPSYLVPCMHLWTIHAS